MGKSKNKKFKSPKPQPTGLPSVKDFETELEIEQESNNGYVNSSTVQNLVEKVILIYYFVNIVTILQATINNLYVRVNICDKYEQFLISTNIIR